MKIYLAKKGIEGSLYNYLGKFGSSLFKSLILVYVIKKLSVESFGIYNLLINILSVGLIFSSFGLPQTIERFIPEFRAKNESNKIRNLFSVSLFIRLGLGIVFVLVLNIFRYELSSVLDASDELIKLIPFFSLVILVNIENQLLGDSFLLANFLHKYWNTVRTSYFAIKFILFFLVLNKGLGLYWIVLAWAFSEITLFIFYLFKTTPWISFGAINFQIFNKRILRFMSISFLIVIGNITRQITVDNFLISHYLGIKQVGLYSFIFGIPLILLELSPAKILKNLFLPIFIRRYTQTKNKGMLERMFTFYNKVIFFLTLPMFLGVAILSKPIIQIVFDSSYLEINHLFRIALIFIFIRAFIYPFEVVLRTIEKINIMLLATLFTVYNIFLGMILIPRLGMTGALMASGSTGIFILLFYKIRVSRFLRIEYQFGAFLKIFINTMLMGVFLFAAKSYATNLLNLLIIISLGTLLFLTASYLNKCFSSEERKIINEAIGKKVFVF